jgi:microsomal epoxide hydrolase
LLCQSRCSTDLRQRLAARSASADHLRRQYGSNLAYIKDLVAYWQHDYDWRAQERFLNSFPQYRIQLDDITLHYIYQPGVGPQPVPLLISHGWPGSIYEFVKIIGPLTDPARYGGEARDAFTVVAPSLPGYGFSHVPNQRRLNIQDMADIFARLMTEVLGYRRFAAQGGDWGSFITAARLGFAYPEQVVGIHLNMVVHRIPTNGRICRPPRRAFLQATERLRRKPATSGSGDKTTDPAFALNDSPAGWRRG